MWALRNPAPVPFETAALEAVLLLVEARVVRVVDVVEEEEADDGAGASANITLET